MTPEGFNLTSDHIKLLTSAYVRWNDDGYVGAPGFDSKRPFGNSDVYRDIFEILGIEPDIVNEYGSPYWADKTIDRVDQIWRETETALQIVLCCQTFEPGLYRRRESCNSRSWEKVS